MSVREVHVDRIRETVRNACIEANWKLPGDVEERIRSCHRDEPWAPAKEILGKIVDNIELSGREQLPLCQDTGATCVFVECGQDVHVTGGNLEEAIHQGVRQGYDEGFLRKSVVKDPLNRVNTGDNTPAFVSYSIVPGDRLKLIVAPKGFGSENMSRLKMLRPSDGVKGVEDFVVETVEAAGSNPCPPIIVGVGIGGNFDKVAALAKKALMRPVDSVHPDPDYQELEERLLELVNATGIGPQGFGGKTTALKVNIETYPTHIAGLPVAVNINCHVTRHVEITL